MRVVQQQSARQPADVVGIIYPLPQCIDHRVEIQHRYGVAVVCGTAQCLQYQLQAVGVTVSADFALVQFQLVQYRLHPLLRHAVAGNALQYIQHQALKIVGAIRLTAFDAAAEHHLAH